MQLYFLLEEQQIITYVIIKKQPLFLLFDSFASLEMTDIYYSILIFSQLQLPAQKAHFPAITRFSNFVTNIRITHSINKPEVLPHIGDLSSVNNTFMSNSSL